MLRAKKPKQNNLELRSELAQAGSFFAITQIKCVSTNGNYAVGKGGIENGV